MRWAARSRPARVGAEHAAAAGQGVLVHLAGRLMLAEIHQIDGEAVRRIQGVRVVGPTQAPLPGQRLFVHLAGSGVAADVPKRRGEVVRYRQGGGVVTAQAFTPLLVQVLRKVMTAAGIPPRPLVPVPRSTPGPAGQD